MPVVRVECAIYVALAGGKGENAPAADVTRALQNAINATDGTVTINDDSMGEDPCPDHVKHFCARVMRSGKTYYYVCLEGQTINFKQGGIPDTPNRRR